MFGARAILSEKVELHLTHPVAGVVQVMEGDSKRVLLGMEKSQGSSCLKGVKFISQPSPNNKLICYFQAEPLFKENPADQIPQQQKKKRAEAEKPVPYAFAYRLVLGPVLCGESVEGGKLKVYELPFIR